MEPDNQRDEKKRMKHAGLTVINVFGYILVLTGLTISLWIMIQIYNMLSDPSELSVFCNLITEQSKFEASFGGEKITLLIPPKMLAIAVPLTLLGLAVSVAGLLIKGGVSLLYGDLQKILLKLQNMDRDFGTLMTGFIEELKQLKKKISDFPKH